MKQNQTTKEKRSHLKKIYDKKPLIEFIVTVLSVPSILLVIFLNYNSFKNLNAANAKLTPTPAANGQQPVNTSAGYYSQPITPRVQPTATSTVSQTPCIKSLGPISITSPSQGDTVSSNPVEVDIQYDDSTYCAAAWQYSVNGSAWSGYGNNSVDLYNLPDGPVTFQLQVESIAGTDTTTITRNFTYDGPTNSTNPTSAPNATQENASSSAQ